MSSLSDTIRFEFSDEGDYKHFTFRNEKTGKKFIIAQGEESNISTDNIIELIESISCQDASSVEVKKPIISDKKATAYVRAKQIVYDRYRALIEADKANTKFKAYAEMDDNTLEHVAALIYAKEILEEAYGEEDTDE